MGGAIIPGHQHILQGGCPVNPLFWIRDLGDDPPYRTDPQRIQPQGGLPFGGDATAMRYGGAVGVPTFGSGNGISGPVLCVGIYPPPPKHHRPLYHNSSNTGAVYRGVAATRSAGST